MNLISVMENIHKGYLIPIPGYSLSIFHVIVDSIDLNMVFCRRESTCDFREGDRKRDKERDRGRIKRALDLFITFAQS